MCVFLVVLNYIPDSLLFCCKRPCRQQNRWIQSFLTKFISTAYEAARLKFGVDCDNTHKTGCCRFEKAVYLRMKLSYQEIKSFRFFRGESNRSMSTFMWALRDGNVNNVVSTISKQRLLDGVSSKEIQRSISPSERMPDCGTTLDTAPWRYGNEVEDSWNRWN